MIRFYHSQGFVGEGICGLCFRLRLLQLLEVPKFQDVGLFDCMRQKALCRDCSGTVPQDSAQDSRSQSLKALRSGPVK